MPRSTYHGLRDREEEPGEGDPIDDAVREEFERSSRRYGARRPRKALERRGIVASRRRIRRSMRSQGLRSRYQRKAFRPPAARPNESGTPQRSRPRLRRPRSAHARVLGLSPVKIVDKVFADFLCCHHNL